MSEEKCCEERIHKIHKVYEEAYQFQENRIAQLEEALRRIHRECFDNLSAPGALKHRTLVRVIQECESVVETPNFGAALSPSEPPREPNEL